jgi:hypothetical protein
MVRPCLEKVKTRNNPQQSGLAFVLGNAAPNVIKKRKPSSQKLKS